MIIEEANLKGEASNGSLLSHNETTTMIASHAHPSSISKSYALANQSVIGASGLSNVNSAKNDAQKWRITVTFR
jgi:hypothetical protein